MYGNGRSGQIFDRKRFVILGISFAIGCLLVLAWSWMAQAQDGAPLVGPVDSPPGGHNVTEGGRMGDAGGYTAVYSDFDFTRFESLYFGAAFSTAVGLAFDSEILESGETLTFSLAASDLSNGVGIWEGSARVRHFDIGNAVWKWETLNTRFVLSATDLQGNPISLVVLETLDDRSLIPVTAPFSVNLRLEADRGGWQPTLVLFNNLHTLTHDPIQSGDDRVISEFTGGFFYTDETIAGLAAENDGPTALGDLTTLTATIAAGTNVSYVWDLGDGESDTGASVTHAYPAIGVFSAIVTASNSVSDAVASTEVVVAEAVAGLSASNDSPTVQGDTTTLTATITAGSDVAYAWAFGDGEFHSGRVVTHVYPVAGEFTAVVTASNSLNQLTASTAVSITGQLPPEFYIYMPLLLRAFP